MAGANGNDSSRQSTNSPQPALAGVTGVNTRGGAQRGSWPLSKDRKVSRGMAWKTNQEFARTDRVFKMACELANIEPTARQASKFRNKKGTARKFQRRAALAVSRKE